MREGWASTSLLFSQSDSKILFSIQKYHLSVFLKISSVVGQIFSYFGFWCLKQLINKKFIVREYAAVSDSQYHNYSDLNIPACRYCIFKGMIPPKLLKCTFSFSQQYRTIKIVSVLSVEVLRYQSVRFLPPMCRMMYTQSLTLKGCFHVHLPKVSGRNRETFTHA